MALFRQLLTARQSVIIDDIETIQSQISSKKDDITTLRGILDTEVAKITALQSRTTSHTCQLTSNGDTLALRLQIENEKIKTVALQSLTESHTSQITSHNGDITALQGRLDIEEQKIIDLDELTERHIVDINDVEQITYGHTEDIEAVQTLTTSHTEDITTLQALTASHTSDLDLKQATIQDGDLTIAKTDGLRTALDSTAKLALANTFTGLQTVNGDLKADHVLVKITAPTLNTHLTSKLYVDTAISNVNTTNLSKLDQANTFTATNSFTDITTTSIINNNKNIDDRDHFHYTSTSGVLATTSFVTWNRVIRGSAIFGSHGFIPKYTGLYSISVTFFFGSGSTGVVRVGLQLNGQHYNLNGTSTFIVCANDTENADSNMFSGNIVVDAIEGQYIRLVVREGTLRYLAQYSYFHGYYIGSS